MTALYLIGAVVALLVLVLFTCVRVSIKYDGELTVRVWYWFFFLTLLPKKEKANAEQRSKRKKSKTPNSKERPEKKPGAFAEKAKRDGMASAVSDVLDFVGELMHRFNQLLEHLRIRPFEMRLAVGGDDAAQTAIECGAVSAVLFPFLGLLASNTKFPKRKIDIIPNCGGENEVYFYCRVKLRIIYAVIAAVAVFFGYIKHMDNNIKDGVSK